MIKKLSLFIALLCSGWLYAGTPRTAEGILAHMLHPTKDYVLVAAHRGDWRNAPENSLNALQRCLDMGVDIMETDVRRTRDGVLILMHDVTVDRTTSGKGRVSDLDWSTLRTLTLRQGHGGPTEERIPTLEEFMLAAKGKPILINLDKCWDIIPEVYAVLRKTGTLEQGLFKGNLPLQELRRQFGTVMDRIHYMPMIHPTMYSQQQHTMGMSPVALVQGFFKGYHPVGFELVFDQEQSPVLTECLPAVQQGGAAVWLNALWASQNAGHEDERALQDPDANWGYLIRLGAQAIQTDRPAELLAYLRAHQLHD